MKHALMLAGPRPGDHGEARGLQARINKVAPFSMDELPASEGGTAK